MRNWPEQWHCVVRAAYRERKQARAMRSPAAYFVRDQVPDGLAKPCIGRLAQRPIFWVVSDDRFSILY